MSIFIFTDGKCSLYLYHAKVSLLEKTKHIMSLHTIQNVVSLSISFVSYLMILLIQAYHQQAQPSSFDAWYFMFLFLEFI